MTVARSLADSIHDYLRDRSRRLEQLEAEVSAAGDERRAASELPQLQGEVAELDQRLDAARKRREGMQSDLLQALETARDRLIEAGEARLETYRVEIVGADLRDAVTAFGDLLEQEDVDPETASTAEIVAKLPVLQQAADSIREAMASAARDATVKLAEEPEVVREQDASQAQERELDQRLAAVKTRLERHLSPGAELSLSSSVEDADAGSLQRLRRYLLRPLLEDCRIEREWGMSDRDSLRQLREELSR